MGRFDSIAGNCLRWAVRGLVRLYYSIPEVEHSERIPQAGPVLLVANHANSLMDAVMIGIAARRPVHFLAKAPLFDIPVFGAVLRALGMLPAFRGMDDPSQLRRNLKSLTAGAEFLTAGDAVGIFPEGKSHDSLKLAMIRSGAARIALQAVKDGARDLVLVPVGINYEQKERFRSSVWIRVGEPIPVRNLIEAHGEEERRSLRALTQAIERSLKSVVIHLEEESWQDWVGGLEVIFPPERGSARGPLAALRHRERIAKAMNYCFATDRARGEAVAAALKQHRHRIGVAGLEMRSPILRWSGWNLRLRMLASASWLAAGSLPALLGTMHHLVPFLLVRALGGRFQAPGRTTTSLVRLGFGLPIYGLWYGLVWLGMKHYFLPWVAWTWTLSMPLAGIFALAYARRARDTVWVWRSQWRLLKRGSALARFREEQETLRQRLQELADEHRRARASNRTEPSETIPASKSKRTLRAGLIVLMAGALLIWLLDDDRTVTSVGQMSPSLDLSQLSEARLQARLETEEKALEDVRAGLAALENRALQLQKEFAGGTRNYYRQEDNDAVRQLLLAYLNYRSALLRIIWRYQSHATIRPERLRLRGFLAGYTSAVILYDASLKFVAQFGRSPEAIRKLNEAEPAWGIPAGLYGTIRNSLLQSETRRILEDAFHEYVRLKPDFASHGLLAGEPYASWHRAIAHVRATAGERERELPAASAQPPLANAARKARQAVYQAQSYVSIWIGDTRIRAPRGGQPLIQEEILRELRAVLRPGDILLERRNWYLSNAFLPGYWPHAALYVGSAGELQQLGLDQDPRVQRRWRDFIQPDPDGHPRVIIESMSEGVLMTSLEHSIGGADSAAVLRPRLDPAAIRESIARAFSHMGKPYDFEFDFFSTDKLVCTELVFRAYDGQIRFPLVDVLGRKTLPAIEMVRKYSQESGRPDAQLEWIAFVEGDERKGVARFQDEERFVDTLKRPALTWFQ